MFACKFIKRIAYLVSHKLLFPYTFTYASNRKERLQTMFEFPVAGNGCRESMTSMYDVLCTTAKRLRDFLLEGQSPGSRGDLGVRVMQDTSNSYQIIS